LSKGSFDSYKIDHRYFSFDAPVPLLLRITVAPKAIVAAQADVVPESGEIVKILAAPLVTMKFLILAT